MSSTQQVETPAATDSKPAFQKSHNYNKQEGGSHHRGGRGGYAKQNNYKPRDYANQGNSNGQNGHNDSGYNFGAISEDTKDNEGGYQARRGGYRGGRGGRGFHSRGNNDHYRGGYHGDNQEGGESYHRGGHRKYHNEHRGEQTAAQRDYHQEEEEEDTTPHGGDDDEEDPLTQDQYNFIKDKEHKIKHLIPSAIKAEELEKICRDFDFEEAKIDEYLSCLEIDEKYRGLPAFEWQQTQTKEQKLEERRKKQIRAELAKRRQARQLEIRERRRLEREARDAEKEERKKERELVKEQKLKEKEEKKAEREKKKAEKKEKQQESHVQEEEETKGKSSEELPKEEEPVEPKIAEDTHQEHQESSEATATDAGKKQKKQFREKKERKPKEKYVFRKKEVQSTPAGPIEQTPQPEEKAPTKEIQQSEEDETDELLRKAVNASVDQVSSPVKQEQPKPVPVPVPQPAKEPEVAKVQAQIEKVQISQPAPVVQQQQPVAAPVQAAPQIPAPFGGLPGGAGISPFGLPMAAPGAPQGSNIFTPEQQQMIYQQMLWQQQMYAQMQQQMLWQQQQLAAGGLNPAGAQGGFGFPQAPIGGNMFMGGFPQAGFGGFPQQQQPHGSDKKE